MKSPNGLKMTYNSVLISWQGSMNMLIWSRPWPRSPGSSLMFVVILRYVSQQYIFYRFYILNLLTCRPDYITDPEIWKFMFWFVFMLNMNIFVSKRSEEFDLHIFTPNPQVSEQL